MDMKHSRLPWRLSYGTLQVSIYSADTGVVAYMPRVEYERPKPIINKEEKANADLILAAVNACGRVNPNNPIAAAEAYSELVATLEDIANQEPDEWQGGFMEWAQVVAETAVANAKRVSNV